MRAMTIPDYGPADVLKLQDVPEPTPGDHELLIEVRASALNPVDCKLRAGKFRAPRDLPIVPGFDASGVVTGMGSQVEGFKEGDEVFAFPSVFRDGAHAEYVAVDYRTAARKPTKLDHATAALLPLVTITAWEAVHTRCRLHHGETILIQHGDKRFDAVQIAAKIDSCRDVEPIAVCDGSAVYPADGIFRGLGAQFMFHPLATRERRFGWIIVSGRPSGSSRPRPPSPGARKPSDGGTGPFSSCSTGPGCASPSSPGCAWTTWTSTAGRRGSWARA